MFRIIKLRKDADWRSLVQAYTSVVKPTDTVLEIGSSTLDRTKDLSSRCKKLIGIELMPERLPVGFENVEYRLGDWQHLSDVIERESIDVAVSSHVIEHVPDDLAAINELYEVLRPGGVAIINTPNRKRLVRAVIEVFQGERQFPFWEHVREYTEEDLISLIGRSKFKKCEIRPIVLGVHGESLTVYMHPVPSGFRKFANFWEIHLRKE